MAEFVKDEIYINAGFTGYINRLEQSNRDQTIKGRINEFTRVVTSNLFEFTEFIEKVVCDKEINHDTLNHFSEKLKYANDQFMKLKELISGVDKTI